MDKWNQLRNYIIKELDMPCNNDDIPKSILEDILYRMDCFDVVEQINNDKPDKSNHKELCINCISLELSDGKYYCDLRSEKHVQSKEKMYISAPHKDSCALFEINNEAKEQNLKPSLNIIDVMQLPVGTKIKSDVCDGKILRICLQDGAKVLKFNDDFRRIFLDNDITEAKYEII